MGCLDMDSPFFAENAEAPLAMQTGLRQDFVLMLLFIISPLEDREA
jgi:hypothetical protein